jgi:phenylalanyl-tRNA synthetase alpha chain
MLNKLKQKILKEIEQAKDLTKLEQVYRQYLGRKGELTQILRSLKDMPEKERKEKGKLANQIKKEIEGLLQEARERREAQQPRERQQRDDWLDVTAPGILPPQGHLHPITLVQRQIEEIFQSMGFSVLDGSIIISML